MSRIGARTRHNNHGSISIKSLAITTTKSSNKWAFSTVVRIVLIAALITVAVITTQIQKHALISTSSLANDNDGDQPPASHSFPTQLESYHEDRSSSRNNINNLSWKQHQKRRQQKNGNEELQGEDDSDNESANENTQDIEDARENNEVDNSDRYAPTKIKYYHSSDNLRMPFPDQQNDNDNNSERRRIEPIASTVPPKTVSLPLHQEQDQKRKQTAPLHHPQLDYAPQRIPGYLYQSNRTLFGYVMRDLTTRVMSRTIAQSSILVVSKDAPDVVRLLEEDTGNSNSQKSEGELRQEVHHTVGGGTLIHAHAQQHAYYGLSDNSSRSVDDWWSGTTTASTTTSPSWFLMMLIDSIYSDEVLRNSKILLRNATVTYIVTSFGSNNSSDDDSDSVYGIKAIETLLDHSYKVQLLSISHAPAANTTRTIPLFRPNVDITSDGLASFESEILKLARDTQEPIRGYTFATQGLDMAIPLAGAYLGKVTKKRIEYNQCPPSMTDVQFVQYQQQPGGGGGGVRINCNTSPVGPVLVTDEQLQGKVYADDDMSLWYDGDSLEDSEAVCAKVYTETCTVPVGTTLKIRQEFFPAQVAAAKVACRTRILPKSSQEESNNNDKDNTLHKTNEKPPPNLLLVMIDPISRSRFERSLVKTNQLIQQLNFTSFSSYTAVGNNSGPNQAALYSGQPLQSRDSISNHTREWLWDTLRKEGGYTTLKAEDGCIENSNMIQSIRPQVHHGDAFNQMMCFDFQRPNCLGGKRAAEHLVEYAAEFMTTYSNLQRPWAGFLHLIDSHEDTQTLEGTLDDVLLNFLFNMYDQKQASRLPSDQERLKLSISPTVWNNTVVILMSDHGLHYGSYLQSPQGLMERSQPIFNIHLPNDHTSTAQVEALKNNRELYATPFDVYQTIFDLLLPEYDHPKQARVQGSSLVRPLTGDRKTCASVPVIPTQACKLLEGSKTKGSRMLISNPPSALSFYADIPLQNKDALQILGEQNSSFLLFQPKESCKCATNLRSWYNCTSHPWDETVKDEPNVLSETFNMIDCPDAYIIDVQVKQDPKIMNRDFVTNAKASGVAQRRPNILWIEVDSVSRAYADRHFPKTRELLNKFRLRPQERESSDESSQPSYECNSTQWCSAEFSEFSVSGSNSIPNQIAAFGGCLVTTGVENCEQFKKDGPLLYCDDVSHEVYGMQFYRRSHTAQTWCKKQNDVQQPISPWLFDISKASGYVTLFAEEFCFDKSPFVAQGNMFSLEADIQPHTLFCRDIERKMIRKDGQIGHGLWRFESSTDPSIPGIDGPNSFSKTNVSLAHIKSMFFEAYPDTPKFAYLNAMAAHVYDQYPTMTLAAEAYDSGLSSFLEVILESGPENTIVIVRSDHGLQGGDRTKDYSIQIEALRPWTEIIVPRTFPDTSLHNLYQNQNRLVTGLDLYTTLATAIVAGETSKMPTPGEWTYSFLDEEIPLSRTCKDAKVPAAYCIYEGEGGQGGRTFTAPNVGTCNLATSSQKFLCPPLAKAFQVSLATDVSSAFISQRIETSSCSENAWSNATVKDSIRKLWSAIDMRVAAHSNAKVSGGIFLYPRQTSLLISLLEVFAQHTLENEGRNLIACETGIGAGHSASVFLEAHPNITLHSFDKFDRPYQEEVASMLETSYPNRMKHYAGDSCETVPSKLSPLHRPGPAAEDDVHCDVLHGSSLCRTDNIDLVENSPCGVLLTSTAMNSLTDNVVYFGPDGQWTHLKKKGCIRDITCFSEEERVLGRNYVFNKNGATISHKFCIAITTGHCQKNTGGQIGLQEAACERGIASFTSNHVRLSQICKAHQVPIPP